MHTESLRQHVGKKLKLYMQSGASPYSGTLEEVRDDAIVLRPDGDVGGKPMIIPLPGILAFNEVPSPKPA